MRYFDLENPISQDDCAKSLKNIANTSIFDYRVNNLRNKSIDKDLFVQNPNLRYRDGYGNVSLTCIDCDTRLRYEDPKNVRGPDRQQLNVRTFKAVPDLSSGTFIADIESNLIHSHDTFVDRGCKSLTEVYYDRNQIFDDCIDDYFVRGYKKSVAKDIRTGVPSRDLKQCPKTNEDTIMKQFERAKKVASFVPQNTLSDSL